MFCLMRIKYEDPAAALDFVWIEKFNGMELKGKIGNILR